jgi:transcriptional/translational regulatory protein YebC/TACO1
VNRAASEMRVLFRKGQLGTSGSVAWDFNHVGMIEAEPAAADADPELAAIEAGAQDCEAVEIEEDSHAKAGTTIFLTDPTDLDLVSRALPKHGFAVISTKLGYKAKNPVDPASLSAVQMEEVEAFLAAIDGNDDVQNVYVSLKG